MVIMPIQMSSETVRIFVLAALCVSIFAATQDVAIDALACSTLREDERGTANGLMFAGAYLGAVLGGSGVLILSDHLSSFNLTFIFVAMAVLSITIFVVLPLRETPTPRAATGHPNPFAGFGLELVTYVQRALRAFFGSRASVAALVLAVLPIGTYSLSLFVQSNIAVELGLTNTEIGRLGIVTGVTAAGASALGGFLADRFGRRRLVAIYVVATAIPPALLAVIMQREGWIMPVDLDDPERMIASTELIRAFYAIVFLHAIFSGLIYGARIAIFMDVCDPKVAATQFTAYMAMMNLVNSYSSAWMGAAVMRIGYPKTFAIDIVFGMLCLAVLPFVTPRRKEPEGIDPPAT
jgi:PAT family beta-lactamase induction signal transducer AmpG